MNRYENIFKKLKLIKERCFIPFITIGYPSEKIFLKIIDTCVQSGADALELGIPFSEPLSDGPIIQQSNLHALCSGITILKCFNIIKQIRIKYFSLPIGILIYTNMILNQKINYFYQLCQKYDIDSVLIPDLPIEEYTEFYKYAKKNNIFSILICPPNANDSLLYNIANKGQGYIYLVSRPGVTGLINKKNYINKNIIKKLKLYHSVPIIQGFGIYTVEQIITSLSLGVHGVICGSVIIQLIKKYYNQEHILIPKIKNIIKKFKNITKKK
ncbi:tryptophan synthase subunit alpha [Buchnera aphidicola]|uniref:Tryptophan synthase alpha chain n=2 Tax=Buchnera aphidicola TaxID=9 RepID=A0A4D6YMV5_9GAMM|nr:tryptophan synthase subunit alpha [Buchnera aphidicola (Stegophylla sp.)]